MTISIVKFRLMMVKYMPDISLRGISTLCIFCYWSLLEIKLEILLWFDLRVEKWSPKIYNFGGGGEYLPVQPVEVWILFIYFPFLLFLLIERKILAVVIEQYFRFSNCFDHIKWLQYNHCKLFTFQSVCSEQKVNALAASFIYLPTGENLDWKLSATISPCHVTVRRSKFFGFIKHHITCESLLFEDHSFFIFYFFYRKKKGNPVLFLFPFLSYPKVMETITTINVLKYLSLS